MMKRKILFLTALLGIGMLSSAYDWDGISVPADAGSGYSWELQTNVSDDFNYVSSGSSRPTEFSSKWEASYHNAWTGPGYTMWNSDQVWSNGSQMAIQAQSGDGSYVYCGIMTSIAYIQYPIYMEIYAKGMDQVLANAFWTLTDDDTEEIDIMEYYGSSRSDQTWFAERMHISHHVFLRDPFTDYQPMDDGSWYYNGTIWREDYHRYGCYWVDPWNLEYYIDGQLVRTVSGESMIDPYGYTGGTGLSQATRIIIDCENQTDWRPEPTDAELADDNANIFWVDWVRFYKPVSGSSSSGGSSSGGSSSGGSSSGGSSGSSSGGTITIEAEDFTSTGGTFDDSSYGGSGYGVNDSGSAINFVNGGDWVDYSVSVSTAGYYEINYNVATPLDGGTIDFEVSGTYYNTTYVANTGSWSTYTNQTASDYAYFSAGSHTVTLVAGSNDWQWNLDNFSLTYTSGSSSGGSSSGGSSSGGSSSGGSSSGGSSSGGQTPYGGTAWSIPGSIESVNFDEGGSGVAYYDATSGNSGSGPRQDTDVDTEYRLLAGNVGWIAANEWLEYTVNVASTGYYDIDVQVASTGNNGAFHISFGGSDKTGTQSVSSTGAWGTFTTLSIDDVYLSSGQQVMQVYMDGSSFNLGTMTFTSTGSSSSSGGSSSGGSSSGGSGSSGAGTIITVQAEDYTSTGGTYDDSFASGPGLGVNDAGSTINYVNNGDWVDYSVSIPYEGYYDVVYYISSPIDGSTIDFSVSGTYYNTTTVTNNGAWDSYYALSASADAYFTAGTHTVTLTAGSTDWTWNLDYLTLEWVSAKDAQESISSASTDLKIYPNPANEYLNIILDGTLQDDALVNIYQSSGSLVRTISLENKNLFINTNDLSEGMYILKVINGSEVLAKTLLIN